MPKFSLCSRTFLIYLPSVIHKDLCCKKQQTFVNILKLCVCSVWICISLNFDIVSKIKQSKLTDLILFYCPLIKMLRYGTEILQMLTRGHTVLPAPHMFNPQVQWVVIPAFTFQPQIVTASLSVFVFHPTECRRLSWLGWLANYISRWYTCEQSSTPVLTRQLRLIVDTYQRRVKFYCKILRGSQNICC